eukprot:262422_1
MPFGLYLVSLVAWIQCCDSSTSNIGQNVSFDLTLVYDAYSTCHRYFGTTNHTTTTLDAFNEIFISTWMSYSDIISPPNSTLFNDVFVDCPKAHNSVPLTTYFIVEFITDYEDNIFTNFSRNAATSIQSYCNHTIATLIYMNPLVNEVIIGNYSNMYLSPNLYYGALIFVCGFLMCVALQCWYRFRISGYDNAGIGELDARLDTDRRSTPPLVLPSSIEIEVFEPSVPHRAIVDSVNRQSIPSTHRINFEISTSKSYEDNDAIECDEPSHSYKYNAYDNDTNSHDMEIIVVSLHECIHFTQQILANSSYCYGGVTCSGNKDSDKTYNGSFTDHPVTNQNGKHHHIHANDNNQTKHHRDEEDDDDKKSDNEDNPCNDSTFALKCNHLNECPSCEIIMTRNREQIKFFRGLIPSLYEQIKLLSDLTESLQCQVDNHAPFKNMIYNAIISKGESKSKRKRNRKPKQNATNIDLYPMRTTRRAKGNIQISKELLEHIIPDTIKETISNVYAYLDRSIAMQYNDGEIIDGEIIDHVNNSLYYEIINCDFHETKSDEPLFCVVETHPLNDAKNSNKYSLKMRDHLFTRKELSQMNLHSVILPESSRTKLQNTERNHIQNMHTDSNTQTWDDMLSACAWSQVPVFTQPEHKQRVTLSISTQLLNRIVIEAMDNKHNLIPIVMFDERSHWMEYICVVHIQKDMDIGIALKYAKYGLRITGIHLDKAMILEQHELVLPHKCECLDGFKSIINDIHVGNADDLLNKLKDYQKRYETLKQFVYWCTNDEEMRQYPALQQSALVYLKNDNGSLADTLSIKSLSPVSSSVYTHNTMHK